VVNVLERLLDAHRESNNEWSESIQYVGLFCAWLEDFPTLKSGFRTRHIRPAFRFEESGACRLVISQNLDRSTILSKLPAINPEDALAEPANLVHLVADEDDGAPASRYILHLPEAFLLKFEVAYRQHLVHKQNLWFKMRRHGKRETHLHTGTEMFQRSIDEPLYGGKGHNLVELARDLGIFHAQNCAAQIDVLAPRQLGMKSSPDLEEASDMAAYLRETLGRTRDPRENLQQRRLSRAVSTDQPNDFALPHVQRHVSQRPKLGLFTRLALTAEWRHESTRQHIAQGIISFALADPVALAQTIGVNDGFAHRLHDIRNCRFHLLKICHAAQQDQ